MFFRKFSSIFNGLHCVITTDARTSDFSMGSVYCTNMLEVTGRTRMYHVIGVWRLKSLKRFWGSISLENFDCYGCHCFSNFVFEWNEWAVVDGHFVSVGFVHCIPFLPAEAPNCHPSYYIRTCVTGSLSSTEESKYTLPFALSVIAVCIFFSIP
jgi:hypothetical protein